MRLLKFVRDIFNPLENCQAVTIQLCQLLEIPFTHSVLKKQLEEHPDHSSLLSVSDVLNSYGVNSLSVKTGAEKITQLPVPMLAQVKLNRQDYFVVISVVADDAITYSHPLSNHWETLSVEDFSRNFTGVLLLAETTEHSGEKDYSIHVKEERRRNLAKMAAVSALPFFTLLICILTFSGSGLHAASPVIYTLLSLAGSVTAIFLLWYEVDQYNPALRQICSGGNRTNCSAILRSKAAKVWGISWSVIGFTWFAGNLLSLLLNSIYDLPLLFILSWLNVLALPYVVFSVYYQARIARQWCVLCLTVQVILFLQFITALWGGLHTAIPLGSVNAAVLLAIIVSFLIPFLIISILLPALRMAKESKQYKIELNRLKHNPQIFEALLAKQKVIDQPTDDLGITIGNPNARHKLVKVCNPYCSPCAKAHPAFEEILHNNPDVHLQIIFTANGTETDVKTPPVQHLMAIAEVTDEAGIKQALDDWYLQEIPDYAVFADKYPMNDELGKQHHKIKAMRDWCDKMDIAYTPTFFVNGHQLPEIYSLADLKYFLFV